MLAITQTRIFGLLQNCNLSVQKDVKHCIRHYGKNMPAVLEHQRRGCRGEYLDLRQK
jgi:hypothetical protein